MVDRLLARIDALAGARRYEDAARMRARLVALLGAAMRMQRLVALTSLPEMVAARPEPRGGGGWEIAVIRHGRLVAAGTSKPPTHPGLTPAPTAVGTRLLNGPRGCPSELNPFAKLRSVSLDCFD